MGMSIDEAIRRIDEHNYIHQHKEPRAVHITEAFNVAVDIMRKYQQIEQIYKRFQKDGGYYHHMAWLDVMEVVENGDDD